jgi:GT2 family glycosyltransferase
MVMEFDTAGVARMADAAGAEFVLYDMEHTAWSIETARRLIATCSGTKAVPFVRIPATEYHFAARVLDAGALGVMVGYLDAHPEVGAVGPQLRYPDGSVQPSRRRFPTVATLFLESTLLQRWFPRNAVLDRFYVADRPDDMEQEVDWLVGAALMARREALEEVGGFDEQFFMYSEELDWCRRARAAGWKIVYLPEAVIVHHEGRSSGQVVAARHIHFYTSKVLYAGKYHGKTAAEALRIFLLATFVWQMAEEWVKWLLGHKRPLRASRIREYREVLRSGLVRK